MKNLNQLSVDNDGNYPKAGFEDNSIIISDAQVSIIFRNHKQVLIEKINSYNCVVGCVAWLTDFDILFALSKIEVVSIVVQKEDFLRPDLKSGSNWKKKLRNAYNSLNNDTMRYWWPGLLGRLSVTSDPTMMPVRCVGNHNSEKSPAFPRMHNKFLIFGSFYMGDNPEESSSFEPREVWTGSYNLSQNAANSFENVTIIKSLKAARAYYNEFCQIYALSEELDWRSDWCSPEFRIGT